MSAHTSLRERQRSVQHRRSVHTDRSAAGPLRNSWHRQSHRCLSESCRYAGCRCRKTYLPQDVLLSDLSNCHICVSLGAFNYLKENFSNAPSLDMSSPSLCMLVRLMVAQVQECVFERVTLTTQDTHFTSQLRLAKESARVSWCVSLGVLSALWVYCEYHAVRACLLTRVLLQVSDVYLLVQQTMTQPLMKDYVPFSWASMVQVKAEHFRALSHYYAAVALCDHMCKTTRHHVSSKKGFVILYWCLILLIKKHRR